MIRVAADPLAVMLEARSVALVGASPRPGSLGARMIAEVAKSAAAPRTYLVNPRYDEIGGVRCHRALADLPEPVDLALLAVPDPALEAQVKSAVEGGVGAAVIFGSAVDAVGHVAGEAVGAGAAFDGGSGNGRAGDHDSHRVGREAGDRDSHVAGGGGHRLRDRLAATARAAGLPVCGAGCMGFVNVARGLRAIGYAEPDPLPAGPVALVTHSGSVFSALLRTRRAFGFTVAVSSGQELVTPAAAYARYALTLPETRVLALVLEAIRDGALLRTVLADAAARDIPVMLLPAGISAASRSLVAAHSGALAAGDGAWQALASAYGVHRVGDLAELADTLELFCAGRRAWGSAGRAVAGRGVAGQGSAGQGSAGQGSAGQGSAGQGSAGDGVAGGRILDDCAGGGGIATVHDSGFERAHVADVAASVGVPFAPLGEQTRQRLAAVLDPGLEPGNPLDVWGTGRDAQELFAETLVALADDEGVGAVALAVDLVPEYDGDESYRDAVLAAAAKTDKPIVVVASIPAAIDTEAATRLRAAGVPVLESTRSGLLALGHLLDHGARRPLDEPGARGAAVMAAASEPHNGAARDAPAGLDADLARRLRWSAALSAGPLSAEALFALLRDYGIAAVHARSAATPDQARAAAAAIGYPVAVKADVPTIAHKSDVNGVRLGLAGPAELDAAYADLSARLGPQVTVTAMANPGVELILGMARDPALGPLIVVGTGGVLAEYHSDRAVALPPLSAPAAAGLIAGQRFAQLLKGFRGCAPVDLAAVAATVAAFSVLVTDLGDHVEAFDVNPLICTPEGVVAVDALAVAVTVPLNGGTEVL